MSVLSGCGAVDPDCGYVLPNCEDQRWLPKYQQLTCGGVVSPKDLMYCRLERCTP
jgi:hypothetical protein